eukprot:3792187-Amphidinium_carterae.1
MFIPSAAAARRAGGRSFPDQMKTQGLLAFEGHEVGSETMVQSSSEQQDVVKASLNSSLKMLSAERRRDQETLAGLEALMTDALQQFSDAGAVPALQFSQTVRSLGDWSVVPAAMPSATHSATAEHFCKTYAKDNINLTQLEADWVQQHLGVRASAASKVKGHVESPCYRAAFCHCRASTKGQGVRRMWQKLQRKLKCVWKTKEQLDPLKQACCAIVFVGFSGVNSDADDTMHVRIGYVPLMYLRPWRPSFAELKPASTSDEEFLLRAFRAHSASESQLEPVTGLQQRCFTTVIAGDEVKGPHLFTSYEFLDTLDPKLNWSFLVAKLSQSDCPFLNSAGKVRLACDNMPFVRFWGPEKTMQRPAQGRGQKRTAVAAALDEGLGDSGESLSEDHYDEAEDDSELEAAADLEVGLLQLWDEMLEQASEAATNPEVEPEANPQRSRSTSSTSSSSSSSSSSSG